MHLVLKNACLMTETKRKSNLLPVTRVQQSAQSAWRDCYFCLFSVERACWVWKTEDTASTSHEKKKPTLIVRRIHIKIKIKRCYQNIMLKLLSKTLPHYLKAISHKANISCFLYTTPQILRIPQNQRLLPLCSFVSQMKRKAR